MFDYEYIGVHNGVVNNSWELKQDHDRLGIKYVSLQEPEYANSTYRKWNDSESLIYDLARYFEGDVDKLKAKGSIAFIVMRLDSAGKPKTLFFGTNRGALKMKRTKKNLVISSEGDGEDVPENVLHMYDYDTGEITTEDMDIPKYTFGYSSNRSGTGSQHTHQSSTRRSVPSASRQEKIDSWADEAISRGYEGRSSYSGYSEDQSLSPEDEEELAEALAMLEEEDRELNTDSLDKYFGYEKGDFVVLQGNKRQIKKRFLHNNGNKHHAALVAVRGVMEGAQEELDRLKSLDVDTNNAEETLGYYALVNDYVVMLSEIADELKKEAQKIADSGSKRESRVMGFHGPQSSQQLTQKQQKLIA